MHTKLLLIIITIGLSGCEGSGVHTSSMSPLELRSVDTYTLCKAYTPREMYYPSQAVIREVQNRNVNCASVYTYQSLQPVVDAAKQAYESVYGADEAPWR